MTFRRSSSTTALALPLLLLATACATQAPTRSGFIAAGAGMETVDDTVRAQIERRRDAGAAGAVRTVTLMPATLSADAIVAAGINTDAVTVVLAELDRQLCHEMSERFSLATPDQQGTGAVGTARVQAQVTRIQRTDPSASVASAVVSRVLPGPGSVRLPVGRGGIGIEAVATLDDGREVAAMSWSRGAGVAFDRGSLSEVGDAHRYSGAFASDFAAWLAGPSSGTRKIPDPDPCAKFGPRLDAGQQVARFGLGLHTLGAGAPEAKAPQSDVSAPPAASPPSR